MTYFINRRRKSRKVMNKSITVMSSDCACMYSTNSLWLRVQTPTSLYLLLLSECTGRVTAQNNTGSFFLNNILVIAFWITFHQQVTILCEHKAHFCLLCGAHTLQLCSLTANQLSTIREVHTHIFMLVQLQALKEIRVIQWA